MSLYLIVVLIHVFTEAICSKKHPYHMRPISVHKFITKCSKQGWEILSPGTWMRPDTIEINMGTYKHSLDPYLTVYVEERKICDFKNSSLEIWNWAEPIGLDSVASVRPETDHEWRVNIVFRVRNAESKNYLGSMLNRNCLFAYVKAFGGRKSRLEDSWRGREAQDGYSMAHGWRNGMADVGKE